MAIDVIRTDKAPGAVGPYSQAIKAGDFLLLQVRFLLIRKKAASLREPFPNRLNSA